MRRSRRFTQTDRECLERAVEHYLRDCYQKRTAARVTEFASFLGSTQPHLNQIGFEIIGTPPRYFLRRCHLDYAAQLLRTTPARVEDIALASAFGTRSTLQRRFRAAFGMTPKHYREITKCDMTDEPRACIIDLQLDRTLDLGRVPRP